MASFLTELDTRPLGVTGPTPCPVNLTRLKGLDISARYHSDRCGGDFFDGLTIGFRLVFLLTDIAGPRSETHAIAAEAQVAFRQRAQELFEPADANESDAIATLAHDVNRSLMEAANGVRFAPTFLRLFQRDPWHSDLLQRGPRSRRVSRCHERVCSRARRSSAGTLHSRHL